MRAEEATRAAEERAAKVARAAERAQHKDREAAGTKVAELKSSLDVERARVHDLKEQVVMERGKAISVAAPLQSAQAELAEARAKVKELEGKRMADGRELTRLSRLVEAQPTAEQRDQTARQLEAAHQAAQAELEQLKATDSTAGAAAVDPPSPQVKPLQPGLKQPYDPFVAEMLRQIVSYGKVPKGNVAAVMALCHAAITREVPDFTSLTSSSHVDEAFGKLGALDAADRAATNATDRHSWAIASDGGSDNNVKTVYKGAVELAAVTRWRGAAGERGEPVTSPLACMDLGNNQTAKQGCAALLAMFVRAGLQAGKLTSAEGDSTEHAHQQRCKFIAELEKLGLKVDRALAENCYRHLSVLEEKASMDSAFPGEELVNMLRMIQEVRECTHLPFPLRSPLLPSSPLASVVTPSPSPSPPPLLPLGPVHSRAALGDGNPPPLPSPPSLPLLPPAPPLPSLPSLPSLLYRDLGAACTTSLLRAVVGMLPAAARRVSPADVDAGAHLLQVGGDAAVRSVVPHCARHRAWEGGYADGHDGGICEVHSRSHAWLSRCRPPAGCWWASASAEVARNLGRARVARAAGRTLLYLRHVGVSRRSARVLQE